MTLTTPSVSDIGDRLATLRSTLRSSLESDRIKGILSLGPSISVLTIIYFLPIIVLFVLSFGVESNFTGFEFTFQNYNSIFPLDTLLSFNFSDLLYLGLLAKSLKVSLYVTIVSLVISYPITYYIGNRVQEEYRLPLIMLIMVPFWTSYLVRTYSWIPILSQNGIVNGLLTSIGLQPLQLLYTPLATNIGLVYLHLPFMILPLYASMAGLNPAHIEAAQDLGATRLRVLREIILPLTLPGASAGVIFVFIKTTAAYVVPTLLGGPNGILYMNVVVSQFRQTYNWNFGAALSFVLLAIVLAILFVAQKMGASLGSAQMR